MKHPGADRKPRRVLLFVIPYTYFIYDYWNSVLGCCLVSKKLGEKFPTFQNLLSVVLKCIYSSSIHARQQCWRVLH